jgi:hypothetical protein
MCFGYVPFLANRLAGASAISRDNDDERRASDTASGLCRCDL